MCVNERYGGFLAPQGVVVLGSNPASLTMYYLFMLQGYCGNIVNVQSKKEGKNSNKKSRSNKSLRNFFF